MGGVAIALLDGLDDASVLGEGLGETDVPERNPAGLRLEPGDGAQHQGEHAVAGELGEQTVEFQICRHGFIEGRAEAPVGGAKGGALGGARALGGGAGDRRLDPQPHLRELPQTLGGVRELPRQRRADRSLRPVHYPHPDPVLHFQQPLDLQPLHGLAQRGPADTQPRGKGAFGW